MSCCLAIPLLTSLELTYIENIVHFLVQSVPVISLSWLSQIIKSINEKKIFKQHPEVKKLLWGGKFMTSGFYINTVGDMGMNYH